MTLDDLYTLVAGEGALRIPEVVRLMQQAAGSQWYVVSGEW